MRRPLFAALLLAATLPAVEADPPRLRPEPEPDPEPGPPLEPPAGALFDGRTGISYRIDADNGHDGSAAHVASCTLCHQAGLEREAAREERRQQREQLRAERRERKAGTADKRRRRNRKRKRRGW